MTKIRGLKELVPSLELCNQIPLGEFEDSALVWWTDCYGVGVIPRERAPYDYGIAAPAPTLQEINEQLGSIEMWRDDPNCKWTIFRRPAPGTDHLQVNSDKSPANVALKIWFASRNEE